MSIEKTKQAIWEIANGPGDPVLNSLCERDGECISVASLLALVESHDRLLKAIIGVRDSETAAEDHHAKIELADAIKEAEKDAKSSGTTSPKKSLMWSVQEELQRAANASVKVSKFHE